MAELGVDLKGVEQNAAAVASLLARNDLRLVGVTKGCAGDPRVAGAILGGGAVALADSRDLHLRRLREAFPGVELQRIFLPPLSGDFEPGDVSFVSSPQGAARVAETATPRGHRSVMAHLETGDLREGVPVAQLLPLLESIEADPRLLLAGLSTNYACFEGDADGILASLEVLGSAVRTARAAGFACARVSGGSSSLLALLADDRRLPAEITEVRCGEALLLGRDALLYRQLPGCRQDAVLLRAEVLERYTKSSRGVEQTRLVLGLGHQDLGAGAVSFRRPGLRELGRSSDYLIVGVATGAPRLRPGDLVEMVPDYVAMATAWASPFVEVVCV
ncbi:MAG: alanine racemase [Thermoleophilia bacterium]